MKTSRAALLFLICSCRVWMCAQIIPKSDVTHDLWRVGGEKMKLYDANAGLIQKRAITPSDNAKLAMPIVAKRFNARAFSVELDQVRYQWHQIDDRFRCQSRHRGGT